MFCYKLYNSFIINAIQLCFFFLAFCLIEFFRATVHYYIVFFCIQGTNLYINLNYTKFNEEVL